MGRQSLMEAFFPFCMSTIAACFQRERNIFWERRMYFAQGTQVTTQIFVTKPGIPSSSPEWGDFNLLVTLSISESVRWARSKEWKQKVSMELVRLQWKESRSKWLRGLRRRSAAASLLRSWVRIPPGARKFVVSVVCCQVEVCATSWSLVQRSPIDCVASLCVI